MDFMLLGMENGITLLLLVISFIIVISAQSYIKSNYSKYKIKTLKKGLSGFEIARAILDNNNLQNVHVVSVNGELSDHYDPSRKVVRLSNDIFNGESIASAAIAAHEVGHALQDKEKYIYMNIRSMLVPYVNLISYLGYFSIFISIFAGLTGYIQIGILIILATLLFQIITLPVEFDASRRAKEELIKLNLITQDEKEGVEKLLLAAAFTYVASVVSSLLNLLRLIIMLRDRD